MSLPFYLLKRHALAFEAHFDFVLVLTYAVPNDELTKFLPPGLTLDCQDDYGFVAVACVQTKSMRPKGWPAAFGQDFFLVGYRIFTRYQTLEGRHLRGLRILRSEANKPIMVLGGNIFTHYNYHQAKVVIDRKDGNLQITADSDDQFGNLKVTAFLGDSRPQDSALPSGSIFGSVREALKFAGPLPFTFDYEKQTDSIIRIEGARQDWTPQVVPIKVDQISFFDQAAFSSAQPLLCSAFYMEDIPYHWKPGVVEKLPPSKSKDI